eukprot:4309557-Pleurochrysis_carterae.AAC.1
MHAYKASSQQNRSSSQTGSAEAHLDGISVRRDARDDRAHLKRNTAGTKGAVKYDGWTQSCLKQASGHDEGRS